MAQKLSVKYSTLSPTALLKLMQQGLKVELPTGYYFKGDVPTKYIEVGYNTGNGNSSDGLWNMTIEGMKNAIADAKKFELEQLKTV